jgi:hypothetical protein
MGAIVIRDDVIWAKHIENDAALVHRICALPAEAPVVLRVDGRLFRFRKMRDGVHGRPTPGLRPDSTFRDHWRGAMQARRGERVAIEVVEDAVSPDPYLAAVSALMSEWDSPEDTEAYSGL